MVAELLGLGMALLLTYKGLEYWIEAAKRTGLVGKDMNKYGEYLVPESGGVFVAVGIAVGLFTYLFLKALWGSMGHFAEIYAVISALALSALIGFTDDVLGWKKGLPQWLKPLLTLILALPLSTVTLLHPGYNPFPVSNVFYSLVLVPIGVVGASNAVNMLAGYNGLEAGLSLLILLFLAVKALVLGEFWITYMALVGIAALAAFLYYNRYPAHVFPGDSLTYAMGTYIAALAILGNLEVFAVALFPLYFLELFLKARSGFKAENFGVPQPDGTLRPRYKRVYSVTHICLRLGVQTERGVVFCILAVQFVIGVLALLLV